MDYAEFIRSPICRPLILAEEDQPQDAKEWGRLINLDRQRQFEEYAKANGLGAAQPKTDEEARVLERLAALTKNKNLSGGVGSRHANQANESPNSTKGKEAAAQKPAYCRFDSDLDGRSDSTAVKQGVASTPIVAIGESSDSPAQNTLKPKFNRTEYQRNYMKLWRAAQNLKRTYETTNRTEP